MQQMQPHCLKVPAGHALVMDGHLPHAGAAGRFPPMIFAALAPCSFLSDSHLVQGMPACLGRHGCACSSPYNTATPSTMAIQRRETLG
eukprot:80433-Chlamydomonas_euryale.AAC.1